MRQKYVVYPWATAGDQITIPDPTQVAGTVSFQSGWTFNYQRQIGTDPLALPIDRSAMNYLMNAITGQIQQYQQFGIPEWIDTADNDDTPFQYDIGAKVRFSSTGNPPFTTYVSMVNANTSVPGIDANWAVADAGNAFTLSGYTSGIASGGSAVDIWTITGNVVQLTGTGTTTGFANAPSAGSQRRLICAGACLFTAGANLLIEGVPSGNTITLGAGASVYVLAISTTQFKLTYSLSGTFAIASTGLTSSLGSTAVYKVENGVVSLYVPGISGTSNSVGFTLTGAPACITPTTQKYGQFILAEDNGLPVFSYPTFQTSGTIVLQNGVAATPWTTSGTKAFSSVTFNYSLS